MKTLPDLQNLKPRLANKHEETCFSQTCASSRVDMKPNIAKNRPGASIMHNYCTWQMCYLSGRLGLLLKARACAQEVQQALVCNLALPQTRTDPGGPGGPRRLERPPEPPGESARLCPGGPGCPGCLGCPRRLMGPSGPPWPHSRSARLQQATQQASYARAGSCGLLGVLSIMVEACACNLSRPPSPTLPRK